MPRPLHEPDICNPFKIQNTFATPVGADLCVGPLHTIIIRNPGKIYINIATPVGAGHAPPAARNRDLQPHQNTQYCLPLEGKVAAEGGRMRCSRRSGVSPCVIILLFSFEQLALFSARSARAKGSGDPAPVPLILWTFGPNPA